MLYFVHSISQSQNWIIFIVICFIALFLSNFPWNYFDFSLISRQVVHRTNARHQCYHPHHQRKQQLQEHHKMATTRTTIILTRAEVNHFIGWSAQFLRQFFFCTHNWCILWKSILHFSEETLPNGAEWRSLLSFIFWIYLVFLFLIMHGSWC